MLINKFELDKTSLRKKPRKLEVVAVIDHSNYKILDTKVLMGWEVALLLCKEDIILHNRSHKFIKLTMGGFRNRFIFPDDIWEETAHKVKGEFVKGRWFANSEIKLSHRDYLITLGVRFGSGDDSTQYTKAFLGASLRPQISFVLFPKIKGFMGTLTSGLLSRSGKEINLPILGDEYSLIGDDIELAKKLFGHHGFVTALRANSQNPAVMIGSSLSNWAKERDDNDEEDFCISTRDVCKDIRQLIAMTELAKILLDLLEENDCLE